MTSTAEAPATEPAADASNGRGRGRKTPETNPEGGGEAADDKASPRAGNKFGVGRRPVEFDLEPVPVDSMDPLVVGGEVLKMVSNSVGSYIPPGMSAAQVVVTWKPYPGLPGHALVTVTGPVTPPD